MEESMTDSLVKEMINSRTSDSVLKQKIEEILSDSDSEIVFAFEGNDEKIVFTKWIERIDPTIEYNIFLCQGKGNAGKLSRVCNRDIEGDLKNKVFIFIDRDYDDLSGFADIENIFMTEMYSIENYICTSLTIDKILQHEFPLHDEKALRTEIVSVFNRLFLEFLLLVKELNRKLYVASKCGVEIRGKPDKISKICSITLDSLAPKNPPVEDTVTYQSPPSEGDLYKFSNEFEMLDMKIRYRGKFHLFFMQKWITIVADSFKERKAPWFNKFGDGYNVTRSELTMGSYASKCEYPSQLPQFLNSIRQRTSSLTECEAETI